MPTPVYVFTGFLDSGKTTLIRDTLNDPQFMEGAGRTLILRFEEGDTEFDEEFLTSHNAFLETYDDVNVLTAEKCRELDTIYHPFQVFIEWNGSEPLTETVLKDMPDFWPLVEILTTVDGSTFASYIQNMRSMMFEQLRYSDVIIVNRCTPDMSGTMFRGNIKAINKRAQIFYEGNFGEPCEFKGGTLPFDINASTFRMMTTASGIWTSWMIPTNTKARKSSCAAPMPKTSPATIRASSWAEEPWCAARPTPASAALRLPASRSMK